MKYQNFTYGLRMISTSFEPIGKGDFAFVQRERIKNKQSEVIAIFKRKKDV